MDKVLKKKFYGKKHQQRSAIDFRLLYMGFPAWHKGGGGKYDFMIGSTIDFELVRYIGSMREQLKLAAGYPDIEILL